MGSAGSDFSLPTLLTAEEPTTIWMMAVVGGKLRVNALGCFEVDHHLLLAPFGSTVRAEPLGIDVPRSGFIAVGESITDSGGWFGLDDLETDHRRFVTPTTRGFVIMNGEQRRDGPPPFTQDPPRLRGRERRRPLP